MDKKALIFPGQGSQYPGLGKDSFKLSSFAKELYNTANDILGYDIKEISFNSSIDKISNTKYAQPLIFIYSMLAIYYLEEKGFEFDMVAGHSLGEISALVSAKSISIEDALKIIKIRASKMETSGYKNPGKMLALLNATKEQVDELCNIPTIVIANINSENQIVVSGSDKNIEKAIDLSKKIDIRKVIKVNVSGAFHSPLMKDVTDDLKKTLDNVNFNDAIVPVYQNMTSESATNKVELKKNLLSQIENQVNWVKIINNIDKNNVKLYIETGPGTVLQGLNKRITKNITIGFNEI